MPRILGKMLLLLMLVLPSTIMLVGNGGAGMVARAQEDIRVEDAMEDMLEGEDDEGDATIETDEGGPDLDAPGTEAVASDQASEEEEEDEKAMKPSPDGDATILFTRPTVGTDFPAGALVKFLVGFTNVGEKDFLVETMDASFRYPQDYSFYIQNFTTVRYERVVEPNRQATFEYALTPSETFNARPFGLVINLNYKDAEGNIFQDAVFNETINIVEPDEGLDGETFFLYIFMAAVGILLLVGAQQILASYGISKKRLGSKPKTIELGTQSKSDVDYDWLPKETLTEINKSPRRSPKQSPGRRRTKRSTGGAED